MDKVQIISTLVLVLLSNMIFQPLIWSFPNEDATSQVDCYDRFSNKIEDLKCEETIVGIPLPMQIIMSIVGVIMPLLMGLAFFRRDMI